MWKRIRKRVNNWIYEEIEDEEPSQPLDHDRRSLETRMKYQYPKRPPFRFPVIEDDEEENTNYISAYKRGPGTPRAKWDRKNNKMNRKSNFVKRMPQNHSEMKMIQDVPAYLRRQRQSEQLNENKEQGVLQEINKSPIPHTKPEELDEVFNKQRNNDLRSEEGERREENFPIDEQTKNIEPVNRDLDERMPQKRSDSFQKTQNKNKYKRKISNGSKLQNRQSQVSHHNNQHTQNNKKIMTGERLSSKPKKVNEMVHHMAGTIRQENLTNYEAPIHLLNDPVEENQMEDKAWINEQTYLLERTLKHFNVKAQVVDATQGSSVTRFEIKPDIGVKVSRIRNLTDDIKLNLAAKDIRIEAPIPGRHTVGIEVPNKNSYPVGLLEIIQTDLFKHNESPLPIALGLTIEGEPLVTTVGKMPHCLIAGATGSGKSVCINTILLSLMYKANYEDVKFLLIDPKMVELAPYNEIPHLISPVITDIKAATASLKWAVDEMESRYEQFAQARVRDISRFNSKVKMGEIDAKNMPYIVIVIDELADLMMASPQDVEDSICRIAQKARACGIHLILATQRPSVDVITGIIKANIPTRISFSVTSQVDSRTIIDTNGAEKLLGKGDMLFIENGSSEIIRLQGPFVCDEEIERVTAYFRTISEPNYLFEQEQLLEKVVQDEEEDELLSAVIQFVIDHDQASTSLLQRQFRIGYNRAARLIDILENRGIISEQNGTKPRDVLLTKSQIEEF